MFARTLEGTLDKVLREWRKMAFVSGPRQCGKTTLAKDFARRNGGGLYFNWDNRDDQKKFSHDPYFFASEPDTPLHLVIFDEIHKFRRWKNYLKGVYDTYHDKNLFLITGSGRLDLYQRGGDSLLGRYFPLPLFQFSAGELTGKLVSWPEFHSRLEDGFPQESLSAESFQHLFQLGGFPEPFLRGEQRYYNAWSRERQTRLIREDIRDATRLRDLSALEVLTHLLETKVGNPLSFNSLREDLSVSFETVRDWVTVLTQFYYAFLLKPYSTRIARAIRKEPKLYLFDWAEVVEAPQRFENFLALHLLKAVKTWTAMGDGPLELFYVRDRDKREVDFLLTERRKPVCLIEAKLTETDLSPHLLRFQEQLKAPFALQIVQTPGVMKRFSLGDRRQWVLSANRWLESLP